MSPDRLWFLAESSLTQGNEEVAVITAVAALEAAVSVYARKRIEPKLGSSLMNTMLREQGMYMLVQTLPKLFFLPKNCPTEHEMGFVRTAIEARNALMHGKHDKNGFPAFYKQQNYGREVMACRSVLLAFLAESRR